MKVLLHVNYFEGEGKLDALFDLALENGYNGVELRKVYRFSDMTQEQYKKKLAAFKKSHPDFEFVFGGQVKFCGDSKTVDKDIKEYVDFAKWASKECGTTMMNFFADGFVRPDTPYFDFDRNGSGYATEEHYKTIAAGLRKLGDKVAPLGIKLALETHNCYIHDLAKPCRKLMDMVNHEAVGINYDHGNIIINKNGGSIQEFFDEVGKKVYYTHLKNVLIPYGKSFFLVTHLEDGHINTAEVLTRLKALKYKGFLTVEYPSSGDGIIAAKRDKEYIDYLLKK